MTLKSIVSLMLGLLLPAASVVGADALDKNGDKPDPQPPERVRVKMVTNMGDIIIELNAKRAPLTVKNFLQYVDDKFYNGTIFHRVIDRFMIQGGGFTEDLKQKKPRPPIRNEANNGLKNKRGAIAMARTSRPHSATAQFYINVVDNKFLDYPARDRWGYCAFGEVVQGLDVVDKISKVNVKKVSPGLTHLPLEPVVIRSITRLPPASQPHQPENNTDQKEIK